MDKLAEFCESTGGEDQWCGVEIAKCRQVKVAGERIFMDLVECVQENKGCMDRVLKGFFYYYQF